MGAAVGRTTSPAGRDAGGLAQVPDGGRPDDGPTRSARAMRAVHLHIHAAVCCRFPDHPCFEQQRLVGLELVEKCSPSTGFGTRLTASLRRGRLGTADQGQQRLDSSHDVRLTPRVVRIDRVGTRAAVRNST